MEGPEMLKGKFSPWWSGGRTSQEALLGGWGYHVRDLTTTWYPFGWFLMSISYMGIVLFCHLIFHFFIISEIECLFICELSSFFNQVFNKSLRVFHIDLQKLFVHLWFQSFAIFIASSPSLTFTSVYYLFWQTEFLSYCAVKSTFSLHIFFHCFREAFPAWNQ